MKRLVTLSLAIALVAGFSASALSGDHGSAGAWFDMEKCGMCSNMAKYDGLVDNMQWESHDMAKGIMTLCTVSDGYLEKYRSATKDMHAAGARMMQGEQMEMCGSCTAMGGIMMSGAVGMESIEIKHGSIMMFTSDDAETVKKLQKWAKRNETEMAKFTDSQG